MPLRVVRRKQTGSLTISGSLKLLDGSSVRIQRRATSTDPALAREEAVALEAEILRSVWADDRPQIEDRLEEIEQRLSRIEEHLGLVHPSVPVLEEWDAREAFAARMRAAREAAGLSRSEVIAALFGPGGDVLGIYESWEHGDTWMPLHVIPVFADIVGTSVRYLFDSMRGKQKRA